MLANNAFARYSHAITPSVRNRLTKARLSDQLAGWYPWATPERLRALTSFQVWMFVVDDEIDQCSTPSSFDSERFTALVDECQDFVERSLGLREGGTENQKYQYHDVIVSFADFADSISSTCSKAYRRRIADEAYVTLQGYRLEAELRARGVYPTEEQYLAYRYGSSCIGQVNEMLEYANGMDDNTAEFSESPEIRELYRASVTVTWLVNDIVSVRKELQGGFLENLVVIYAEGDLEKGVQRALALLEKEISALTTAYAAAVKRFEGTPPYAEKVKKLADNCLNLNRRTWLWRYVSQSSKAATTGWFHWLTCPKHENTSLRLV